ncbi:hypothetical protein CLV49_2128 [Labedella gwakjiensis]|uniref:Uncharacterized protein n=1 Tax=Labedella gwakjiensis TaxID=390269 RepID=A0A2P8GX13_9MICO|nr:hypothetical protein [Labedella gwakjiensis]PSL38503.1 hypothetical protein CLV49_2128 [Labedella gwakjiensis]RUQ86983.1 hypothetical protein ELQ93_08575 [Labedella gwakjiensis]
MTNGTGGGFPTDGDEPVEGARTNAGDDAADASGASDPDTEGVEILDDGADWLAIQLAALPVDTTDIPVVRAEDERSPDADDDTDDGLSDDGPEDTSPATQRLPILPDDAASAPVSARSSEPAPTTPSEPPLTRPRAPEPMPGWFAPSSPPPPRPPMPTPAAADEVEDDESAAPVADSGDESAVAEGSDDVPASGNTQGDATSDGRTVDGAVEPEPASSAGGRAHPNAIVLPGLPKRATGAADASTPDSSASATRDEPADEPTPTAVENPAMPAATPAPRSGIPEDSGEIDFGSFSWSLVANDEDDPRIVRERREAEERAAEEAETARLAAEAAAAAAAAGAAAPSAVPGSVAATDDDEREGSDASASGGSSSDDSAAGLSAAEPETPSADAGPPAEAPTWSRPDLDDAFPATAAMSTLPADEDPDDPDDELDAADRFSALGTAAMPVSAASAAAGAAEHTPTPSVRARAESSDSVFPDGLVAESDAQTSHVRPDRVAGRSRSGGLGSGGERGSLPLVAAGVVIVLALVGLFYLGTRLPLIFAGSSGAAASATPTPTATPEPTAEQPASGPLAPGTYAWDELRGGECLDPYSSPWAEEFTVVDCSQPHAGQLVFAAPYTDDPADPFPGEDVIASEIGLLCSAPGVVDFGAAAPFTDLQVQGSYPVSGEQWAAGNRDYFCFASRSSGEPLTTSVATPTP